MLQEYFFLRINNCLELWEIYYNIENFMWKNERNKRIRLLKRKIREKYYQYKFNYEILFLFQGNLYIQMLVID